MLAIFRCMMNNAQACKIKPVRSYKFDNLFVESLGAYVVLPQEIYSIHYSHVVRL
jgi:hypothetical protein